MKTAVLERGVLRFGVGVVATAMLLISGGPLGKAAPQQPAVGPVEAKALVPRYCAACHSEAQRQRGLVPIALDTAKLDDLGANAEVWESVVRKMRAGLMPPAGR